MMRRLFLVRRHVPLDLADAYLAGWSRLRDEVEAVGGRAWIFRGTEHEDRFIEFIEWAEGALEPLTNERVTTAATDLDVYAPPASAEEWEEAE